MSRIGRNANDHAAAQPQSVSGSIMESTVLVRLTPMWRCLGDKAVVFSDAHFNLVRYEFNGVGARVWALLDGKMTVAEVIDVLAKQYPDASRSRIAEGVVSFAAELCDLWLAMTREQHRGYE